MAAQEPPSILGFVADLLFASRIESVAERLNYRMVWIEHAHQVAPPDPHTPARQLGEHLIGQGAALLEQITRLHPALILFDLSNRAVPWREWLPLIKSVPATRRIPVVCFGSHVDVETMKAARDRGADAVLARSRFASNLPEIITKYARLPDYDGLESACHSPLSDLALKGLEMFNHGDYFEAHEYLEEAWNEDASAAKELYRAILQVAVAYLQIERGNYNGAMKMFLRVRQWIDPLPARCRGVNIDRLREDARRVHDALVKLGPDQLAALDRRLLRPVEYEVIP